MTFEDLRGEMVCYEHKTYIVKTVGERQCCLSDLAHITEEGSGRRIKLPTHEVIDLYKQQGAMRSRVLPSSKDSSARAAPASSAPHPAQTRPALCILISRGILIWSRCPRRRYRC